MVVKMNSDGDTHMISMPQGSTEIHELHQFTSQTESVVDQHSSPAVDIVVYFAENIGLQLRVVDGQNATASELFEMVMEEQSYPEAARELFSLWLVSDLLELQLKPTHIPFKLVCYWEELLEKYSSASEYERQRDEPVIMFRRNVFCSYAVEDKILSMYNKDEDEDEGVLNVLRLLYHEAKKNILSGRYPVSQQTCDILAAIQSLIIQKESCDKDVITIEYFRSKLSEFLPAHFCKRKWLIGIKTNPEWRLFNSFETLSEECQHAKLGNIYRKYIVMCREQPFYGCAFFRGQVEHPGHRLFTARIDDPVLVAINLNGVYVIDEDDFVLLIGLPYKFLCWERAESANLQHTECLPCLFLQFPESALEGHANSPDTKLFQIFSKETVLMDKLIETCIQLRKNGTVTVDHNFEENIIEGRGNIAQQFQRLALITYNAEHKRVGKSVRVSNRSVMKSAPV